MTRSQDFPGYFAHTQFNLFTGLSLAYTVTPAVLPALAHA